MKGSAKRKDQNLLLVRGDSARREAGAIPVAFDAKRDGDFRPAGTQKMTMDRMGYAIGGNGVRCSRQGLRENLTAEQALPLFNAARGLTPVGAGLDQCSRPDQRGPGVAVFPGRRAPASLTRFFPPSVATPSCTRTFISYRRECG